MPRWPKRTIHERFWDKVQKLDNCWEWTGAKTQYGYGQLNYDWRRNKRILAHRLSYEIAHGSIPLGLHVLHHCDNPPCVRPEHLFLGTDKDNVFDAIQKNRFHHNTAGEANGRARIRWETVRKIRTIHAAYPFMGYSEIGKLVGLSRKAIGDILLGRRWPIRHDPQSAAPSV